jgi:dTDP-4-dehydrorhamnose reductase
VHVAGGGRCSWYEFAVEIFRQAPVDAHVNPCSTAAFPRPAPRPTFSVLGSERGAPVLPDWQEGLRAYLAERAPVS